MLALDLINEHLLESGFGPVRKVAQNRHDLLLGVNRAVFVYIAVEMDREARDRDNGSLEIDQQRKTPALGIGTRNTPGNGKIPVKPRGQQYATIDFNTELQHTRSSDIRRRF